MGLCCSTVLRAARSKRSTVTAFIAPADAARRSVAKAVVELETPDYISFFGATPTLSALISRVSEYDKERLAGILGRHTCFCVADMPSENLSYVSPTFTNTFGYSNEEVVGTNCRFLQADQRDQNAVHLMRTAIQKKEAIIVLLRNFHKNGTLVHNIVSLKPLFAVDGSLFAYLGCQEDVTDQIVGVIPEELLREIAQSELNLSDSELVLRLGNVLGESLASICAKMGIDNLLVPANLKVAE